MIDRNLFVKGPHTQAVWDSVADIVTQIEQLDFLGQLADGNLGHEQFVFYLLQDEIYLDGYARAMSLLAARAPQNAQTRFWAGSAADAISVEQDMHEALLTNDEFGPVATALTSKDGAVGRAHQAGGASPTALGYCSYLVAQAATAPYPVGVAAVLPCFWVYAHVGKLLTERVVGALEHNPFRAWLETYDSPEFDESTMQAVQLLEDQYARADADLRAQMNDTFRQACIYELQFWASALIMQDWGAPKHQAARN